MSRRSFLVGSAAFGAATLWQPVFRVSDAWTDAACPPPPGFPSAVPLYRQAYENWSGEIRVAEVWTCMPRTPEEVVEVANWAAAHGYRLRPRGAMHGFSPLTVTADTSCETRVVLIDMTQHLSKLELASTAPPMVRVQTGATMDALLAWLEGHGYGLTNVPGIGVLTVGGVLAVAAHGAGAPARDEPRAPDHPLGTLSNLVLSITTVVWDGACGRYVLKTFDRSHPHCAAFLTHLGRTAVTEVTLRVGANQHLRCVSHVDIPAAELFAPPGSGSTRTLADFVEASGRVEAIWFPFSDNPWLKVWSISPTKPLTSRKVDSPYNYPFTHDIPPEVALLADEVVTGNPGATPQFGKAASASIAAGLTATQSADIWGLSKNVLLWVKPSSLRVHSFSQIVLTRRDNLQRVISELAAFYLERLQAHEAAGRFPMNMPFEIRATGIDRAADVGVRLAEPPALSPARPRPDRPDWDTVLWPNLLTFPGTEHMFEFYRELERWMYTNYTGEYALVRPAWSGSWAHTAEAAWADPVLLSSAIPDAFRAGYASSDNWDWAMARLDSYDPHRVFSNALLDTLMD